MALSTFLHFVRKKALRFNVFRVFNFLAPRRCAVSGVRRPPNLFLDSSTLKIASRHACVDFSNLYSWPAGRGVGSTIFQDFGKCTAQKLGMNAPQSQPKRLLSQKSLGDFRKKRVLYAFLRCVSNIPSWVKTFARLESCG